MPKAVNIAPIPDVVSKSRINPGTAVFQSMVNRPQQPNVFQTVNSLIEFRRQNELKAAETDLAKQKMANETAKLELEARDLVQKSKSTNSLSDLFGGGAGSNLSMKNVKDLQTLREIAVDTRNSDLLEKVDSVLNPNSRRVGEPDNVINEGRSKSKINANFETDPFTGKLTPKGEIQKSAEEARVKLEASTNFKKDELLKLLESTIALESTIPRSEEGGIDRIMQGAKNKLSGFLQNSNIGENIATYEKNIDLLTPKIARASGDVANIAVAERKFSRNAFPGLGDTAGTAEKKRAFLSEFTKAIDSEDKNAVLELLDKEDIPYYSLTEKKWFNLQEGENDVELRFESEEEAGKADLPDGTPVIINGVKGKWVN